MKQSLYSRVTQLPPAYILAGGMSSRFGTDKARVLRDGIPSLIWLHRKLLESGCPSVTVVARSSNAYHDLGIDAITDNWPGMGPIAGLEASLSDTRSEKILLVSCDLLEVRSAWLQQLAFPQGDAVAFRDKIWHPFPGCYHRNLLPILRNQLACQSSKRSFQGLLNHNQVASISIPIPCDWPAMISFNTKAEFETSGSQVPNLCSVCNKSNR
jgi:molybdopterin-guanine dinucleotide biosynthesis protein A